MFSILRYTDTFFVDIYILEIFKTDCVELGLPGKGQKICESPQQRLKKNYSGDVLMRISHGDIYKVDSLLS